MSLVEMNGIIINKEFIPLFIKNGLKDFQSVINYPAGKLFKKNRLRSVVEFSLMSENGEKIFHLKRHAPPFLERLKGFFSGYSSCARQEWEGIKKLSAIGIPTMVPVAFGERRKWGLEKGSFSITEHIYHSERVEEFIPKYFIPPLMKERIILKRQLTKTLALLAKKIHLNGIHHQDFYLGHIFIHRTQDTEHRVQLNEEEVGAYGHTPLLYLIDLQRIHQKKRLRERWIIKDLAQLNFSSRLLNKYITNADRLRLFLWYKGIDRLYPEDKVLIRKIFRKTLRIEKRYQKIQKSKKVRVRVGVRVRKRNPDTDTDHGHA